MTQLRGTAVVLRGFRPDEIDLAMQRMTTIPARELDGERRRQHRERVERSGARNDWEVLFAIEADGRVVGDVQGRCSDHAFPPGVWELGIELWDETDRGRGLGREAVSLLSGYLFGEEAAIRVQATTDIDNGAMRGALERLGFGFEGVLHGYMPSPDGPPRDYAMFAMTRDDWETTRETWTPTS
ncbi:MAG: GNAT family N-acetyltransferase [Actinomycetota bacterium]